MKILHISDQPPGYSSGGQLGILQFSYAWTRVSSEVDYVGPPFDDKDIEDWYHSVAYLDYPLNGVQKAWSLLHCQFDRKYLSWQKLNIDFDHYDLIYIDFTKMDFALKDIRKAGYKGKVIVRAHNVEADFFKVNYQRNKSWMNWLKYRVAEPRERYMVNNADRVLAITPQDKSRLNELYQIPEDKILICPVGINHADESQRTKDQVSVEQQSNKQSGKAAPHSAVTPAKLNCLITGSLWFGPNAEATAWFINDVYPSVKDIITLTVAGARPNDKLKSLCRENGITLADTPVSMEPYFKAADLFLAPIFDGGGMKVKIAEAMSYNLPIVTTSHGAIGYEIKNGENCFVTDTAEEFAESIRAYKEMSSETREKFLMSEWELYRDNYSLEAITELCRRMADSI